MAKHSSAPGRSRQSREEGKLVVSGGQAFELMAAVASAMPRDLNPVDVAVVNQKFKLWQDYYRQRHGLALELDGLRIPPKQEGLDRLIVVAQGLTLNRLVEIGRTSYQMWLYTTDLDRAVVRNDRCPKETYAIWVRDRQEADEEMANLSAEDIWAKQLTGETLLERLIHGDEEFTRTGRHLDEDVITLCTGSRDSGGGVPCVGWGRHDRRVYVRWCRSQFRFAVLRCRLAVA